MNSAPMFQAIGMLVAISPARQDQGDDGMAEKEVEHGSVEPLEVQRISQISFSWVRSESPREAMTGMKVSDRTSEPARAKITVRAMGRKSLPSVPWRARMGR